MVVRYHPVDFLIQFTSRQVAIRILHALALEGVEFVLVF
jgi:hypothetical protein